MPEIKAIAISREDALQSEHSPPAITGRLYKGIGFHDMESLFDMPFSYEFHQYRSDRCRFCR